MSVFTVREYDALAKDANGHGIPAGQEPAIATQVITTSGVSQDLNAFQERTRFILIGCDGICNWAIGASPTAAAGDAGRLAADEHLFFGVAGSKTPLVISVIDDT